MSCELLLATAVNSVVDYACIQWKVGKSKEVWVCFEHQGASANSLSNINIRPSCLSSESTVSSEAEAPG